MSKFLLSQTTMARNALTARERNLYVVVFSLLILFPLSTSRFNSIQDLLQNQGLPKGLLPRDVKSFAMDDEGQLEVILNRPCLAKFENRVYFENVIRANLSCGRMTSVVGFSQEELFLWLPVIDIKVGDPASGLIVFDIGVVHKQFSFSLFDDPPQCESDRVEIWGLPWKGGRKDKVLEAQR